MDQRKRPVRPSAAKAQASWANNGNGPSSDDDEEASRPVRSSRRHTRVDLSKLDSSSLHKYRKVFKLDDIPQNTSKENLLPSVTRHFANQVVDEDDVLQKFILAVQRQNKFQKVKAADITQQPKLPVPRKPLPIPIPMPMQQTGKQPKCTRP